MAYSCSHCQECGRKLLSAFFCHPCQESFCSLDCLIKHRSRHPDAALSPEAPPQPGEKREPNGTDSASGPPG
jgi:hypothetical protein